MVIDLIVAGDINEDLLRTGGVAVAMLGFRKSPHTFPRDGERVDIRHRLMW